MRGKIIALVALTCIHGFLFGQAPPPSYTVKEAIAEWRAPQNKSFDEVWVNTVKVLWLMECRVKVAEKPSGFLIARDFSPTNDLRKLTEENLPEVEIFIMPTAGGCGVMMRRFGFGPRNDFYKAFFTKLADALK
jgi:hypothetical protein